MRRWLALLAAVAVTAAAALAVALAVSEDEPAQPKAVGLVGPPATDPCGPPVMRPNGTPWLCTFAEDFDESMLDPDRWQPLATEGRKHECRVDDPANIALRDGVLLLTAQRLPTPITCTSDDRTYRTSLTAGGVTTNHRFSQVFGRVEIRAAMPEHRGPGFHSALWMYPQVPAYGPWPASGEIDIAEYRTGLFGRAVPTVHWRPDGRYCRVTDWNCALRRPEEFHSYVLEWSGAGMRFVYDGTVCLVVPFELDRPDPARPFDQPFFVILNQSHGISGNKADRRTPSSATMRVDSVKVWR